MVDQVVEEKEQEDVMMRKIRQDIIHFVNKRLQVAGGCCLIRVSSIAKYLREQGYTKTFYSFMNNAIITTLLREFDAELWEAGPKIRLRTGNVREQESKRIYLVRSDST